MGTLTPPSAACPLCDEGHDVVLALLAEEPNRTLRRIASGDLADEREYLRREMAQAKAGPEYSRSLAALYRHRLSVVDGELERRRRLEEWGGPKVAESGLVPDQVIEEIKCCIDLAALIAEDLGEAAWYRWGRVKFACRLHGDGVDRDPSLQVYEEDHHWWCYGCGDGGDCFAWLLKARNMQWREAVEYLAKRLGIELRPEARGRGVIRVG